MGCPLDGYLPVDEFALVSYISDPLGHFLDLMRLKLAPGCRPHAHVTILPPRPLCGSVESAEAQIRETASQFHSFQVSLGSVEIFESTDVVYIELDQGSRELSEMHEQLNHGAVEYAEPYRFHPHITLAQNISPESVQETLRQARQFWSEWKGSVTFPVEELSFVQNTTGKVWLDLMHLRLANEPAGIIR
jgi:2'-5' RNA ligase